ncbi:hypothetical protein EG328_005292 [Venturia inaequalis]|uniref:Uncharacterized protein n=1 Tax=Venturia inaequalis TaxID=5025 RepID=A0A8H3VNG7_VENIN|nr:hypothetical protein EG328_005292 [Venturia inaequalis]KAE9990898.1 hypothetical protein EG327_000779 [Venturia inaequalis]
MNIIDRERFCSSTTQAEKKRAGRRPRPTPINTAGIGTVNATGRIKTSKDRTPDSADAAFSPRLSAQATPQAIVTAIRWQSPSILRSKELAFSFSPTSPSYLDSAFPCPESPMETTCLPSGRVLKSPFSYAESPYPVSPPPSASRLCPNTYRDIPRIDTNVQSEDRFTSTERMMLSPASLQRARREYPQSADSPVNFSPTTPVTVEVGYPIILDPVTPTIYTRGLAMLDRTSTLPSSNAGPVRTRARRDSLKRGRDPYRSDLRGQGGVSQRNSWEPRLRSSDEQFLAMDYGYGSMEGAANTAYESSRRPPQVDRDGYGQGSWTQQQRSYTSYVTPSEGTEDALRRQISRC